MQSDVTHVLAVLDRQHQPGRPQQVVARKSAFTWHNGESGANDELVIDDVVFDAEDVREPPLRNPPVQGHLAAFEAAEVAISAPGTTPPKPERTP